jgi:hypothetical protein
MSRAMDFREPRAHIKRDCRERFRIIFDESMTVLLNPRRTQTGEAMFVD